MSLTNWLKGLALIIVIAMGLAITMLRADLAAATARLEGAKTTIKETKVKNEQLTADLDGRDRLIAELKQRSRQNDQLAAKARDTIDDINGQLAARAQRIKQLERQNEALRNWSATHLPDPVIGLRKHPAFTGPAEYRAWLSASNAVPLAGVGSTDQRRSK